MGRCIGIKERTNDEIIVSKIEEENQNVNLRCQKKCKSQR